MSQSCQLAAIMFTDIQGYTALMQTDEKNDVEIRERHRKIFIRNFVSSFPNTRSTQQHCV